MAEQAEYRGTDNVLADLGFPGAEELAAKTILAKKLNDVIDSRHLTQSDAAELLGMPQPKVSAIRNYKLRGISLERLMRTLTALGQHIEIVVSPSTHDAPAADRRRGVGVITAQRPPGVGCGHRTRRAGQRRRCLRPVLPNGSRGG